MDRVGIMQSSQSVVLSLGRAVAQVPGNKAAVGQYYNAAADRYVTFDGIVKALAKEVGKEPKIMLYDEGKVSLAKGEGVPFRTKHFFAQVRPTLPLPQPLYAPRTLLHNCSFQGVRTL